MDLDGLDQSFWDFLQQKNLVVSQRKYLILNIHHLAITMLTRTFVVYMKVLRKYVGCYGAYSRVYKDFLKLAHALSNVRLTHQIIDSPRLDRYLREISYDLRRNHQIISLFCSILKTITWNHWYPLLSLLTNCVYRNLFC